MTLAQADQMLGRGGGGNDSFPPPWVDQKIQGQIGLKFVQNVVFQRFFYIFFFIIKILNIENKSFVLLINDSLFFSKKVINS